MTYSQICRVLEEDLVSVVEVVAMVQGQPALQIFLERHWFRSYGFGCYGVRDINQSCNDLSKFQFGVVFLRRFLES